MLAMCKPQQKIEYHSRRDLQHLRQLEHYPNDDDDFRKIDQKRVSRLPATRLSAKETERRHPRATITESEASRIGEQPNQSSSKSKPVNLSVRQFSLTVRTKSSGAPFGVSA